MEKKIYIGYEPRETNAYLVACRSIRTYWPDAPIYPVILGCLQNAGLYTRAIQHHNGQMYDVISDAPMSTEFAVSRFFTPVLAQTGLALFMDCDVLVRTDLRNLFALAHSTKAVTCVQHIYEPEDRVKMDDQIQSRYKRKNWSSVMLWNVGHPANKSLTLDILNSLPGRDLHALCWLKDEEIGALGTEWNYLSGITSGVSNPKIVHFTNGIPTMPGYENTEFADEWREILWREVEAL